MKLLDLFEINMSPGKLSSWAESNASTITLGFEAELIFPRPGGEDDSGELEYDFSMDREPESIDDVVEFFEDSDMSTMTLTNMIQRINKNMARNDIDFIEFMYMAGLDTMKDITEYFSVEWPFYKPANSGRYVNFDRHAAKELAIEMSEYLDVHTRVLSDYHGAEKNGTSWYFEPDRSIEVDPEVDSALPVEIVSPPLPFAEAIQKLTEFTAWCQMNDAYTNNSTGFHVSMSMPSSGAFIDSVDYLKLVILLGDEYVLSKFDRLSNDFCQSILAEIDRHTYTKKGNEERLSAAYESLRRGLGLTASKAIISVNPSRYFSVNLKDDYVEFRSIGGNYLEKLDVLINFINRFARALTAAMNPDDSSREYKIKLYKLLKRLHGETFADTISLFTEYASTRDVKKLKDSLRLKKDTGTFDKNAAIIQPLIKKYVNEALKIVKQTLLTYPQDDAAMNRNMDRFDQLLTTPMLDLDKAKNMITYIVHDLFRNVSPTLPIDTLFLINKHLPEVNNETN